MSTVKRARIVTEQDGLRVDGFPGSTWTLTLVEETNVVEGSMNLQQSLASVTEHAPALHVAADQQTTFTRTRRFVLAWDNSRIPPSNRRVGYNYREQQRCDGVCFGNGLVALDLGRGYENMGEMEPCSR